MDDETRTRWAQVIEGPEIFRVTWWKAMAEQLIKERDAAEAKNAELMERLRAYENYEATRIEE